MGAMRSSALAILLAVASLAGAAATPNTLDIYFIDVEGGQSTLLVMPDGQSMLIDSGYPDNGGRDPDRIMAAVGDARLSRLDYLVITHFHEDHVGGAAGLAGRIPIDTFVDYGAPVQTASEVVATFNAYEAVRRTRRHLVAAAGDRLPLRAGDVEVNVVAADGVRLPAPLDGGGDANPACTDAERRQINRTENPRSIALRVRFGAFRFFDPGDLDPNTLADLVCPTNLLGQVDAYLVAHHGSSDTNVPVLLPALRPRIAVVNNGEYKGGSASWLQTLREAPGIEQGVWQLHRSLGDGAEYNVPDAFIANLGGDAGDRGSWIKLSAAKDGAFTVTNGRTGETRSYSRR
jgi:beta-lactamase superfamily II metal-dependent hydrolase